MGNIRVHAVTGIFSTVERRLVLGLGRYASEQSPPWEVAYGHIKTGEMNAISKEYDALLTWASWSDLVQELEGCRLPLVQTSRQSVISRHPLVCPDDLAIGRMGYEFLRDCGLKHLCFIGRQRYLYSKARWQGFAEAHGPGAKSLWMSSSRSLRRVTNSRLGEILAEMPKPVGIMCCCDWGASDVVHQARMNGLRVPEDCAIIGVDDDEIAGLQSLIPLTSIDPGFERIGYEAGRMIHRMLDGDTPPHETFFPPVRVVERRSTDQLAADNPKVDRSARMIHRLASCNLTVDDVVRASGMNRRTLERAFRRSYGRGIEEAIRLRRLAKASEQLRATTTSIGEIAYACGFSAPDYFSAAFRKHFGVSPLEFREQKRIETGNEDDAEDKHVRPNLHTII